MKRFILVLVLSCSFLLLFTNVSFATLQMGKFTQINYNGNIVDFFDALLMRAFQTDDLDNLSPNGSTAATNLANLYTYLDGTTYNYFYFRLTYNSTYYNNESNKVNYLTVKMSPNEFNSGIRTNNLSRQKNNGSYNCTNSTSSGYETIKGDYDYPSTWDKYLVIKNGNTWTFYQGERNQNESPSMNLKFIPSSNTIKNIQGVNFYIYKFNRNFPYISIGQLFNLDNYNDVVGSLYMFTNSTNYDYFVTNTYNTIDGEQVQLFTNNLYYNQGYAVNFKYQDYETGYYYIYFLPSDINISGDFSGDIVYGGNDNNNIVPIQNAINQQYNVNSGELLGIINNELFPSGDLSVISNTTGFDNYSNNYFDLLYNFYRNIITTLTSSGNVTLPLSYRNWSMTLNSSDFTIPDNPIKSLVCIILVVWCIYLIYQDLDKQYRHIREFNLFGFLHDTDVDYHMFL